MAEAFISEIRMFSFGFAPKGWATCDGQTLSISQNQALFALLGITYGGNGTTTFQLPDLRGRTPIHFNSSYPEGAVGGAEGVSLGLQQMPTHTHTLQASTAAPTTNAPATNVFATLPTGKNDFAAAANLTQMNANSIGANGSGLPHENMQPSLAINYCIALVGVFPSRN
jgi:microcystin-dependent protein